jgi:hypothetical protein
MKLKKRNQVVLRKQTEQSTTKRMMSMTCLMLTMTNFQFSKTSSARKTDPTTAKVLQSAQEAKVAQ